MPLSRATLRNAVKTAFIATGDIPRKSTYQVKSGPAVRDLDEGTYTVPTVNVTLPMVLYTRFTQKDVDKNPAIVLTNTKCLIPSEDLKGNVPSTTDTITDNKGQVWEVIRLLSDPAEVLTIIEVRVGN